MDADTIDVEGAPRIRLFGIDAPESGQTCTNAADKPFLCGVRAADALSQMLGRNPRVTCIERDRDRYGRAVASCSIGGRDIGDALVRAGWALDFTRYSRGVYEAAEEEARDAKRGLWARDFEAPWEWRARRRARR